MDDGGKKNFIQQLLEKVKSVTHGISAKLSKRPSGGEGDAVSRGPSAIQKFGETLSKWRIREKIQKVLPKDLGESLPDRFDPIAILEWLSQAFQGDAIRFYGKGLTLLICAYLLANISAFFVEGLVPDPPVTRIQSAPQTQDARQRSPDRYDVIVSRNLFNSEGRLPGQEVEVIQPAEDPNAPPEKTSLPFNLVGTLILRDELRSIATIEDKSASAVFPVRVEDEIPSKARILKVEARRVIFTNITSGKKEYVEMPEDAYASRAKISVSTPQKTTGIQSLSPTHFMVSRATVDKSLQDINKVLTEARAVPNIENGQPAGYKIFQIVPGSIYDQLGMKNGDTICGLNGDPVNDPTKALQLLSELKTAKNLDLCIKRDGRRMDVSYDIQ
ncbi:MAG: hypothetical protein JNL01_07620 [Bdellovibrionales bacterium]|nr:hypothetical protein [Bdellovibrionales bacterium]